MLLRSLTLTNYGLYAGSNVFDLAPRTVRGNLRPVVLFGGKNGAGKTTILESIRLALYGRLALGPRISQEQYTDFLRSRVHRGASEGPRPSDAAVSIDFDHVERGQASRYVVERSWAISRSGRITESLAVSKDGKPVDEVDAELWPGFVRDIIPEGLSQLFFFDGEKIRELAEDTTGTAALADAVKSLLGLDVVERLQADLTVYAARQVASLGSQSDRDANERLARELAGFEKEIEKARQQVASLRTKTDGVLAEIRRAEDTLRRDGKDLAGRRERLATERVTLAAKIEATEKAIRDQCDQLFPLSLCPNTAKLLSSQLKAENATAESARFRDELAAVRKTLLRRVKALASGRGAIPPAAMKRFTALTVEVFDSRAPDRPAVRLHGLSESESRRSLSALHSAKRDSAKTVREKCSDLARWARRLDTIDRSLTQIPSDDVLGPHVEALNVLNRRLGALNQKREEAEESSRRAEIDAEQRRRDIRRLTELVGQSDKASNKLIMAQSANAALADYLRELTSLKLGQLRSSVATCFNRLVRKGELIARVDIDPQTFEVALVDRAGTVVPKEQLSSGEKQIFAIALLWALATTSGRPLPVIIDTPLGRLDSDHRLKLVKDYLPLASHQVIVLSTDTEVDESLFEALRNHVSHAYRLTYVPDDRRTRIDEGYFWKTRKEALV